jgi:serine/threonine-protein kinase
VLYEMLTGRRAFDGEDISDTLAAVLRAEPDWSALPDDAPPSIRTLLDGCLEKDRRVRFGDISTPLFLMSPRAAVLSPVRATREGAPLWRRLSIYAAPAFLAAFRASVTRISNSFS